MTHFKLSFVLSIVLGFVIAWGVSALTKDDIVFPVAELGNCQDEQECRAYCDDPENIDQCIAFAQMYGLLSEDELEKAKKFQDIGGVGPGGCRSELECETYCEDITNIEECLVFAEEHGFMEEDELEEAQKVAQALRQGARLPGGCTSKDACETYCEDPDNMRECITFAEQAGFISEEELKEAKQVLKALDAGVSFPGNCKGKSACEAYCEDPSHMEECFNFAVVAGFIPEEEIEEARRIMPLMAAGKMPGGCREREECEAYCSDEANMEECANFAAEAGLMSPEELDMFRKTGGKGPGGCKGQEQCEAFCNDPANQQACFEFGKEHGLISEEDLQNMEEGMARFREGFEQAPPEVADCLRDRIGTEVLEKIEAGTFMPNPELGDHMRACFEEFMPRPEEGFFEGGESGGFPGQNPEQMDCIERILGDTGERSGPPTPEQEQQLREECFGSMQQQFTPPQQFEGDHPQGEFEEEFRREFNQEFQQEFREEFEHQFQQQLQQIPQNDSRAAACAEEGGIWDGTGCRVPGQSGEFFSETGPSQDQQVIQQTQEQIQRQIQQQQLEQQIQEQERQLQEQLQLLQQQTSPPPPTAPGGGNILEAVGNLLRQFLRR